MMINTSTGMMIDDEYILDYFDHLVDRIFKILPIRENRSETLPAYMRSLQIELIGCGDLVDGLHGHASYVALLATLQYLIDNSEVELSEYRREVFKAIRTCNKLKAAYKKRLGSEVAV